MAWISEWFTKAMKIGGKDEIWIDYLYFIIPIFSTLICYIKTKKHKLYLSMFIASVLPVCVFYYYRSFGGILLDFETYIGK